MRSSAALYRQRGISMVLLLTLVAGLLLVTGGATVAALYLGGVLGGDPVAAADEPGPAGEAGGATAEPASPPAPPIYLPIEPALVANFENQDRVGFLQLNVELMARDPAVIEAVQTHMAVIRNDLLFLMGGKSYDELKDRAGKEALRQEALVAINHILAERDVDGEVEAVYFTAFVMQ